jgi:hypothetical protein
VLLLAGLALLAGLVLHFGPATLLGAAEALGPRLLLLLVIPAAGVQACFALGWGVCFPEPARRPTAARLGAASLVGEAFNTLTLLAQMGGEPLKAHLLRPWVPLREGLATVVVARTARTAAQGVFLAGGLALTLADLPAAHTLALGLAGFGILLVAAGALLARLQQRGLFSRGLGALGVLGVRATPARAAGARGLDERLRDIYRSGRARLGASIAIQLAGFALGAVEVALACHFLGSPVSATQALAIEAIGLGVASALFVVPGGLGVSEGGRAAACAALGLDPALGLVLGLVRRLRDLGWAGAGLALYAALPHRRGEAA